MFSYAGCAAVGILAICLSVVIYRVTLHPLARYPGPFYSAVSIWPHALAASNGTAHERILKLHLRHGSIVRYAPNALSFNTVEALQDIYANRNANVQKTGWIWRQRWLTGAPSTHNIVDRQQHAQRRKLLSHAFSENALRHAETYILSKIRDWCSLIYQTAEVNDAKDSGHWSKPRDFGVWTTFLTLDVLGDLCFGTDFETMKTRDPTIEQTMKAGARLYQTFTYLPIPFQNILLPWIQRNEVFNRLGFELGRRFVGYRARIRDAVRARTLQEKASADSGEAATRKDFYHYLLHAEDTDAGLKYTDMELIGDAGLLLTAGTDTSASTLSALVFYLIRHPTVLKRLIEEIRGSFNDVEEIKGGPQLQSLTYLKACVEEALRISPPVPGVLERKALKGGITVDGKPVPQACTVAVAAFAIHHNEQYYERPFDFIPERWIPDSQNAGFAVTKETVARAKAAFCAFSQGPRNCIGMKMAYLEMYLAIARLLFLYDIRGKEGDTTGEVVTGLRTGNYLSRDWFVMARWGPIIELKARPAVMA